MQNLYLVHCGFYDPNIADGMYESHLNLFVVAGSFDEAKQKAKSNPDFKTRKMHIDGMQEIQKVDGYDFNLIRENTDSNETRIVTRRSTYTG